MKEFFRKPSKVALISLIATIGISILLICVLKLSGFESKIVHMIGKVTIAISLPFLILNPLFGFIYSFFIQEKGKSYISYCILHVYVQFLFLHL
jgi:hypothetical protein